MNARELDTTITAAVSATIVLHTLMAAHHIPSFHELHLLLEWPAGLRDAHRQWVAAMVSVVNALARTEGIPAPVELSAHDKVRLTQQAYTLVMRSAV